MTNRPSNLPGSTTDEISLGTLGTYEGAFVDLIEEAVNSGRAVRADGLAVHRRDFDSDRAFRSARSLADAFIYKHFDRGVEIGRYHGECEIIWDEEEGRPQVSAKPPRPEDRYSPSELARELIGAYCADSWTQDEAALTEWAYVGIVADDAASFHDRRSAERVTTVVAGCLQHVANLLVCIGLVRGTDPVSTYQDFTLLDRDLMDPLLATDPDRADVEAARDHVIERLYGWDVDHGTSD